MCEITMIRPGVAASGKTPEEADFLPHNIEAEQQLLGAILTNNDAYDKVSPVISGKHFYDPVHARIFETAAVRVAYPEKIGTEDGPVTVFDPGFLLHWSVA